MASSFGIGSIFNKETVALAQDTHQVQYIEYDKLKPNPVNTKYYKTDDIEVLADSILDKGLIQPLTVVSDGDGTYTIISGHRRYLAIKFINDNDLSDKFKSVPSIIRDIKTELEKEELLIDGNLWNRNKTDAERAKEIAGKKAILEQRKKNGEYIPGRIMSIIANEIGISERQAKKLNSININCSEEVKEMFDNGQINLETAYSLAHYDKDKQNDIVETITNSDEQKFTAKAVKEVATEDEEPPITESENADETSDSSEDVIINDDTEEYSIDDTKADETEVSEFDDKESSDDDLSPTKEKEKVPTDYSDDTVSHNQNFENSNIGEDIELLKEVIFACKDEIEQLSFVDNYEQIETALSRIEEMIYDY